jgi:hypothetical protein
LKCINKKKIKKPNLASKLYFLLPRALKKYFIKVPKDPLSPPRAEVLNLFFLHGPLKVKKKYGPINCKNPLLVAPNYYTLWYTWEHYFTSGPCILS